jgi:hypothetical protein
VPIIPKRSEAISRGLLLIAGIAASPAAPRDDQLRKKSRQEFLVQPA